jgi:hypothetical protein
MNRRSAARYSTFVVLLAIVFAGCRVQAQMGGELPAKIAENNKKLKQYTYQQKTEVFFKGELKTTKLAEVHFDATTGERIVVPMNGDSTDQPQQPERRRRMGQMMEKRIEEKKGEMKEYIERLVGLMHQYLPPNPDKIKEALPHAQITPPADGNSKIAINDYLKSGDAMTFSVNAASKKMDQILINSSLDSDPVSFAVDFARLPDDTSYPSMTSIKSPAKDVEIRVTTSDYHK